MDYETLEIVFRQINEFLLAYPNEKMSFTWHGGEPCLLGAEYFEKAWYFQETLCPTTKDRIEHLIQTNLTALTQELIDVFKKLKITSLGSSYDYTPNIRGFGKDRDEKKYMKAFFKGYNLARRNDLRVGVIYVVHKHALKDPIGVFNHLVNLLPGSSPQFNRLYMYHDDKYNLGITMEEYGHFLGKIFVEWWHNQDIYPSFKPVQSFIDSVANMNMQMGCFFAGWCSHNWVGIFSDGSVTHCGRTGDFDLLTYGNIREDNLIELFKHDSRNQFKERIQNLANGECKNCRFWGLCHGGCPLDAYMGNNSFEGKAEDCRWITTFLTEYFEPTIGEKLDFYPGGKNFVDTIEVNIK